MPKDIDWTFDNLYYFVQFSPYYQYSIGIISVLLSIVLFYVVIKSTPEELVARRANVITQLVGCVLQSVLSSLLQPTPLYPHQAMIFTGPLRNAGSFACGMGFVLWVSSTTFTANSAIIGSVSHYLGTMEGVRFGLFTLAYCTSPSQIRQSNVFLDWYARRTFFTKSVIITCSHTFVIIWSGLSLFVSIDFNEENTSGTRAILRVLKEEYALIHMKTNSVALLVLGFSFSLFTVFYFFQLIYINSGVQQQLNAIKTTISPRTWEILHHTSRMFLGIAVQPVFSFILPTAIFIPLNFAVSSMGSSIFLNASVFCTIVLYTSSTLLLNLFTLIPFKIYRHHFQSILKAPFSFVFPHRSRRISVAPQLDFVEMNKVTG